MKIQNLSVSKIVALWMDEYDYSAEGPHATPAYYPVAYDSFDDTVVTGDQDWIKDYISLSGSRYHKEHAYVIGTWQDILNRIAAEPRLKNKIEKAEKDFRKKQEEYAQFQAMEEEKQADILIKQMTKKNPWIPMSIPPVYLKGMEFYQYLVTDGNRVKVAQCAIDKDDNSYLYVPGENKEVKDVYTHWMPIDKLIIYLMED